MNRINIRTNYEGIVKTKKSGNNLIVMFPDGSTETVEFHSRKYNRFFDLIPEILGVVKKTDGEFTLMLAPYVMLHNHGEYSLLDGMSQPKQIAKKLQSDDDIYTPFFALTDHGLPSGLPAFDATLSKNGLCPINGVEFYAESLNGSEKNHHLILLAKNAKGYENLSHLCTQAQTNFYRHANITYDMLKERHEGLICLSACLAGELAQYIIKGEMDRAEEFIEFYQELFGDDFYLEIQNHGLADEAVVRNGVFQLAEQYGIKVVATTDSHYINKEDSYAHEILLAIGTKKTMNDEDRFVFDGTGYHILSANEFYDLFADHPETISNAFEIAEKCNFHFKKQVIEMPYFEIPEGFTEAEYFDHLAKEGFKKRFEGTPMLTSPEYIDRLNYELEVIHQMGFEGYLLIVQDFINYAKSNGIAVGPGRGSAVGSLVSYCLNIIDLDPIPYGLLFERELRMRS